MDNFANARLFVYGTLRRGFRSHELLRRLHARFLAEGHAQGKLFDLGDYPGAVESASGADRIHGEVYLLPNPARAFKVLDRYEGCHPAKPALNLFERKESQVILIDGGQVPAWIYWLRREHCARRHIPSGNYRMFQR